jgi:hypothetical protein
MIHDWRKEERELYGVKGEPKAITVPRQNFIAINGKGDPNQADFADRVGVLYSLAYPIKMRFKDYTVYPLEGVWTSADAAGPLNKDKFVYTIMIRQPEHITKEIYDDAFEIVKKKKPNPLLGEVRFAAIEDGLCVQVLHTGAFEDEPASFARMDALVKEMGLRRRNQYHREIYLNDARKTKPENRMTILRYQVE